MVILKCKSCGGDIRATGNATFGICDHCGTVSTLPKAPNERKANLFNRANHFRMQNHFDRAMQAYENILNNDSTDSEAYWGVVLSRYGIEYVEDPATHEMVPTCRRLQRESILKNADYLAALKYASDDYTRSLYVEEAGKISKIQKNILAISYKEKPCDIFICYKEKTDDGSLTRDSVIAQDLYEHLTKEGFRVFFSKITLEDKIGQQYEPYIFSALSSARVMLVMGTQKEYFESVWVKNEWSRFLALMKKDRTRSIIPCYLDMDPYDIPEELLSLGIQAQDMAKIGFIQDILRGVKKLMEAGKAAETAANAAPDAASAAGPSVASLMKRGHLFLEDSDWEHAEEYFNKVLDINPEYAPAYSGMLCANLRMNREAELANITAALDGNPNYEKILRYGDKDYLEKWAGYEKARQHSEIEEHIKKEQQEKKEKQKKRRTVANVSFVVFTISLSAFLQVLSWTQGQEGTKQIMYFVGVIIFIIPPFIILHLVKLEGLYSIFLKGVSTFIIIVLALGRMFSNSGIIGYIAFIVTILTLIMAYIKPLNDIPDIF